LAGFSLASASLLNHHRKAFMPDAPLSPTPPAGAVFLSYASQDAEAAQRIAEGLRAAHPPAKMELNK